MYNCVCGRHTSTGMLGLHALEFTLTETNRHPFRLPLSFGVWHLPIRHYPIDETGLCML